MTATDAAPPRPPRTRRRLGALRGRAWAVTGHLVVGVALMGWIGVQVAFLEVVVWLHVVYFSWGAVTAALALWLRRLSPVHLDLEPP